MKSRINSFASGDKGENYEATHIRYCEQVLQKARMMQNIMVDCSHGNFNKDATRQLLVIADISRQIVNGNKSIVGLMIESRLGFGNQKITNVRESLEYGVSITDSCIDWDTTEKCLIDLSNDLSDILSKRIGSVVNFSISL